MNREEAIETIKKALPLSDTLAEAFYTLHPELAESEDERIRKEIRNFLIDMECKKEWIAYMEKQKDLAAIPDELVKNYKLFCENGRREVAVLINAINGINEQKEQSMSATEILARAGLKPYKDGNQWCILAGDNIQEGICGFGDTIDEALYEFLKEVLTMANSPQLKEQKLVPEHYSPLCNTVKDKIREYIANHFVADTVVKTDVKSIVKAMEEGVRLGREECRPAEWSEEDELMVTSIIDVLKRFEHLGATDMKIDWLENRLKSLRPQPHWKPSEEQMDALSYALQVMNTDLSPIAARTYQGLQEIHRNLRKLTQEG